MDKNIKQISGRNGTKYNRDKNFEQKQDYRKSQNIGYK